MNIYFEFLRACRECVNFSHTRRRVKPYALVRACGESVVFFFRIHSSVFIMVRLYYGHLTCVVLHASGEKTVNIIRGPSEGSV
jgi:hypothetical protein